jgi:TPR repeat protein
MDETENAKEALLRVGVCDFEGGGIEQNYEVAFSCYTKSYSKGILHVVLN